VWEVYRSVLCGRLVEGRGPGTNMNVSLRREWAMCRQELLTERTGREAVRGSFPMGIPGLRGGVGEVLASLLSFGEVGDEMGGVEKRAGGGGERVMRGGGSAQLSS